MKNLLISIALLLPIFVKSQDTIRIPTSTAKTIVKELISCDSIKAIHQLTEEQLVLTESKVAVQDQIITSHIQKETLYEERIKNEQQKFNVQSKWVEDLRKENKKLKAKLLFTKITMGAIISGITYLYITK
jgi:hypothetical protein